MKIKIKNTCKGIGLALYKKFKTHREFYDELGIDTKSQNFHDSDWDFNDECDGFRNFLSKHQDKYNEYIRINGLDIQEIDIMSCKNFSKLLEILSQYLFLRMSKQAEKKLDIGNSEADLLIIKKMLTIMLEEGCIGVTASQVYLNPLKASSDLNSLINATSNLFLNEINGSIISVKEIEFNRTKFYFLFKQKENKIEDELPQVLFNGNNIVAIHIKVPDKVMKALAPPIETNNQLT